MNPETATFTANHHPLRTAATVMAASLALAGCNGLSLPEDTQSTPLASTVSAEPTSIASQTPEFSATTQPDVTKSSPTPKPESSSGVLPNDLSNIPEGEAGCLIYFDILHFKKHEYEICSAYANNSAEVARQGYYKFANNTDGILARTWKVIFEDRYWEKPRRDIESNTATWKAVSNKSGNKVDETVKVLNVQSDLNENRGFVKTYEKWTVKAKDGTVLYYEPEHEKWTTLCRVKPPHHLLHIWAVVANSKQAKYDCAAFAARNNLKQ